MPLMPMTPLKDPDPCVARAERVIARMQAGGRTTRDPSNWRPAQAPWR